MPKQFTLSGEGVSEFRTKGSRFYGRAYQAANLPDIKQHLHTLQEIFSDATHICYAYRLMTEGRMDEFSTDGGEPGGSAGRPILNVLRRESLINTLIFVIRYYGGTKLGIPGLIEAYGTTAAEAVGKVPKRLWVPSVVYTLTYRYEQQPLVESIIRQISGKIVHRSFGEQVEVQIKINCVNEAEFKMLMREKSSGTLQPKKTD
ncbi:MAG: YigZ family protein [FCB group bacterium]|nr:YigZ family protein [FCB group bacterium]